MTIFEDFRIGLIVKESGERGVALKEKKKKKKKGKKVFVSPDGFGKVRFILLDKVPKNI